MVDAEKASEVVESTHFHFTDTDEHIVLKVCRSYSLYIGQKATVE